MLTVYLLWPSMLSNAFLLTPKWERLNYIRSTGCRLHSSSIQCVNKVNIKVALQTVFVDMSTKKTVVTSQHTQAYILPF